MEDNEILIRKKDEWLRHVDEDRSRFHPVLDERSKDSDVSPLAALFNYATLRFLTSQYLINWNN